MNKIGIFALGLALLMPELAWGQVLNMPSDIYRNRLQQTGNAISFCIESDSMMAEFDTAVIKALSDVLLVTGNVVKVRPLLPTLPLDYQFPFEPEDVYKALSDQCEAFVGFTLADGYPDWLRVTRPYWSTQTVLAVISDDYHAMSDIPFDQAFGSRIVSNGDSRMLDYFQTLPRDQVWKRFPSFDNTVVLKQLQDGTIAGAVIWEPALVRATGGDLAAHGIHTIPMQFTVPPTEFGIAVRSDNSYLATLLSQAADEIREDGTVQQLAVEYGLAIADDQ